SIRISGTCLTGRTYSPRLHRRKPFLPSSGLAYRSLTLASGRNAQIELTGNSDTAAPFLAPFLASAQSHLFPEGAECENEAVHLLVGVHRTWREPDALGAAWNGWIVDRLNVNPEAGE